MSITTTHILVYPFPAPGHIIPLLDLTHRLLSSHHLTITFFITHSNLPLLRPFLSHHSCLHQFILPDPQESRLLSYISSLHRHHYPLILRWLQSLPSTYPPVSAIISDFFLGWTRDLASHVGIRHLVFSPSGASAVSVTASLWLNQPRNPGASGGGSDDMDFVVSFPDIPNCPTYPWWQISNSYRRSGVGDPDWEFFRECFVANLESCGIIINSFDELERVHLQHLKRKFGNDCVFAVGPLLPSAGPVTDRGGPSSVPCHEVMTWLDQQGDNSVIYINFGSREMLTCEQMKQLSSALEKSPVHFIWCVRQPNEGHVSKEGLGMLPDGFEDRVAGRGYIMRGWAPQVEILKHPAVGSFLSHCGWNSVIEAVTCGVVILTWPMGADQFINAELLVKELGIGIRVGEDVQKIPQSGELAKILAESLEENLLEREKAKRLEAEAVNAVNNEGSSCKDLNSLAKKLTEL